MKVGVAGQGAFGQKHLEGIAKIPGIEVITLTGGNQAATEEVAKKFKIPHWTGDLAESLKQPGLEAMILATPTQMHAKQGEQCMRAGKHVQIEIPIADTLADSERLVKVQKETGVVCMGGHTRRFNPSHQYVHKKIKAGELKVQQMNVQTYFFRRTNMNAAGKPRSWTDHLLWHHACHTVDLFQYQTGELVSECYARAGPNSPGIENRHGHGHRHEDALGSDLHAVAFLQQQRAAGHIFPLHLRQRHVSSPGTTICWTARRTKSTCPKWTYR